MRVTTLVPVGKYWLYTNIPASIDSVSEAVVGVILNVLVTQLRSLTVTSFSLGFIKFLSSFLIVIVVLIVSRAFLAKPKSLIRVIVVVVAAWTTLSIMPSALPRPVAIP